MPQPPAYNRQFSFTDFQGANPADPLPSSQFEIEFNAIKATLDAALTNLALIQRDDGVLANLSVGNDQLEISLRTGVNPPTVWTVAPTVYVVNDTIYFGLSGRAELWLCIVAHTSSTNFDTDSIVDLSWSKLADWTVIALTAAATSYDNTSSGLTAEDVQAAVDEINTVVAAGVVDGDKGDITVTASGTAWAIDAGVVVAAKLATDAVENSKIKALAVTTGKIALLNITTALLNASAVTAAKLATNAVETAKIKNVNVTTAKIALNAITLALMEHGTAGDILYYGASGVPSRLAKGADGEALVLASGIPAWGSPITRKTAINTTSGTVHSHGSLAAGASRITVMLDGVSLSGSDELLIQLGDAAGPEASGYLSASDRGQGAAVSTIGFIITIAGSAAKFMSGAVVFERITGNTWVAHGVTYDTIPDVVMSSGTKTLSAELTQIQLITDGANTFDAGKFNIFVE